MSGQAAVAEALTATAGVLFAAFAVVELRCLRVRRRRIDAAIAEAVARADTRVRGSLAKLLAEAADAAEAEVGRHHRKARR